MPDKRYIEEIKITKVTISINGIVIFLFSTLFDMLCRRIFVDRVRGPPSPDFQLKNENLEGKTCQRKNIIFT